MTEFAMGSDTYGVGAGEALSLTIEFCLNPQNSSKLRYCSGKAERTRL
ncbi:MAG: hypothetical protein LBK41_01815 [Clostridiales bacterium]|nr:hypothetical protein [Clostridiales bacterium]